MEEYVRQVNTNIELSQEIERLKSIISSTKEDFLNANSKNIELEDKLQQKENIINKAIHRIQLLQMDEEVSVKDLTKLASILTGSDKG